MQELEQPQFELSKTPILDKNRAKSSALNAPSYPQDPNLMLIVNSWLGLPVHIKKSILTLIQVVCKGSGTMKKL